MRYQQEKAITAIKCKPKAKILKYPRTGDTATY